MSDRDLLSLLSQSGFGSALFAEPEGGSGPTVHVLDVDPYATSCRPNTTSHPAGS